LSLSRRVQGEAGKKKRGKEKREGLHVSLVYPPEKGEGVGKWEGKKKEVQGLPGCGPKGG